MLDLSIFPAYHTALLSRLSARIFREAASGNEPWAHSSQPCDAFFDHPQLLEHSLSFLQSPAQLATVCGRRVIPRYLALRMQTAEAAQEGGAEAALAVRHALRVGEHVGAGSCAGACIPRELAEACWGHSDRQNTHGSMCAFWTHSAHLRVQLLPLYPKQHQGHIFVW